MVGSGGCHGKKYCRATRHCYMVVCEQRGPAHPTHSTSTVCAKSTDIGHVGPLCTCIDVRPDSEQRRSDSRGGCWSDVQTTHMTVVVPFSFLLLPLHAQQRRWAVADDSESVDSSSLRRYEGYRDHTRSM